VASGDAGSSGWLSLSGSLQDTGSGVSLGVSVNSASLPAGSYPGTITLTATDSIGHAIGTSEIINVTLNVTATVSGTVVACQPGPAPACTTPAPLPGAVLMLYDSSNRLVETTTADGSGNYTFTNLLPGNYTVNITGTDANNVHYSTSGIQLTVSGNQSGMSLNVYPG
jgi:hypothetical protein